MSMNPLSYAFAKEPAPRPSKLERQRHERHLQISNYEREDEPSPAESANIVVGGGVAEQGHGCRCCCRFCSPELRNVVFVIISRMLGIGLLLLVVHIIYAGVAFHLYRDYYELGYTSLDYFGEFYLALYTLFSLLVNSVNQEIIREVAAQDYFAWPFFVSFYILVSFISIPLTIVVIDDSVRTLFPPIDEKTETQAMLEARIDDLMSDVMAHHKGKHTANQFQSKEGKEANNGTEGNEKSPCCNRTLLKKLVVILSRLLVIGFVLLILYLIFAALVTYWFGSYDVYYFGTIGASMFTLFTIMVDGGSWYEISLDVMRGYYWAWIPLLSFLVLSTFISIPVTIVVVDDAVRNLFPPVQEPTETDKLLEDKMNKLEESVKKWLDSLEKMEDEIQRLGAKDPDNGHDEITGCDPALQAGACPNDDSDPSNDDVVLCVTNAIEEEVLDDSSEKESS